MAKGPVEAAKNISNFINVTDKPRPTRSILQEFIEEYYDKYRLTALDLVEKWIRRFDSRVRHDIAHAEKEGAFLTYTLNSANPEYIQGSCFVEPCDDADIKEQKSSRARQQEYLDYFSNLSPSTFERLCGRIIELLKVESPYVTRSSADQGIDFFGKIPFGLLLKPSSISPGAEKNLSLWIVGQAKHYKETDVSTKDLRELVGSVAMAKSKVYAGARDPLKNLEIRLCDPVVYLFVTTGRFTRDSKELLHRSGIVAMDGIQLSVFLADHQVAISEDSLTFEALSQWISSSPIKIREETQELSRQSKNKPKP